MGAQGDHLGYARIVRLLQPLAEEREEVAGLQEVRREIERFDALGVGEDEAPDAERRDLRQDALEEARARHREQQVDRRRGRKRRRGVVAEPHDAVVSLEGDDGRHGAALVEESGADLVARSRVEDVADVQRAAARDADRAVGGAFGAADEKAVHRRPWRASARGRSRA